MIVSFPLSFVSSQHQQPICLVPPPFPAIVETPFTSPHTTVHTEPKKSTTKAEKSRGSHIE